MRSKTDAKTVLITGASSGIGYELAKVFAAKGHNLVLVARQKDKLQELAALLESTCRVSCKVLPRDLSEPSAARDIFDTLARESVPVDVLVNNAGFGCYGFFKETDLERESEMIRLNILSLTQLTKYFLKPMLTKGWGRILQVASTAAFQPGPTMAVYYATKAYVLSFSAALANELKGTGVTVTCLCPGPTRSGFQKKAGIEKTWIVRMTMMDAACVARAAYRALEKGQEVVIPGLLNRLGAFGAKISPRSWAASVVRVLQKETS